MSCRSEPRVRQVDGPMLPHPNHFSSRRSDDGGLPRATMLLVPILTPPLAGGGRDDGGDDPDGDSWQQYLLVPNHKRIAVRSARRGRRVRDLVVPEVKDGDVTIRAVKLAWLP